MRRRKSPRRRLLFIVVSHRECMRAGLPRRVRPATDCASEYAPEAAQPGRGRRIRAMVGKSPWQAGDFNLAFGQSIHPCTETTHATLFENDGNGGRRILASFEIPPSSWKRCLNRPDGKIIAILHD